VGRHQVCITFDLDAVSGWVARGMTTATPVSRGEFAVVGTRRILALLGRRGVPSTWFIPGHTIESFPSLCAEVRDAGHEIAHHGWSHVSPAMLSPGEEVRELDRGCEAIIRLTGRSPLGYRSPAWDLSPRSVELLLERGFIYDSSMMADDYAPYRARRGDQVPVDAPMVFGEETDLIEVPVSWSLDDYPVFEYLRMPNLVLPGLRSASDVLANWLDDFRYLRTRLDWGVITYTFHPSVIGRGHRMLALEHLLETLERDGANFVTVEQVAREAAQRLCIGGGSD
jgi:peptidoglycan-N-acetylglucosamine deacetylase